MPTLPLYRTPDDVDAWRDVRSPGGYESWRLDAEDHKSGLRLLVNIAHGSQIDPGYLQRYARYRHRPTRIAPPTPRDCTRASMLVFDRSALLGEVALGDTDSPHRSADGSIHLAALSWVPIISPPRREINLDQAGLHRWILSTPLCAVTGNVTVGGRSLPFSGQGYYDHSFGTRPLAMDFTHLTRGRLLFESSVIAFVRASPNAEKTLRIEQGAMVELKPLELGAPKVLHTSSAHTITECPIRTEAGEGIALCETFDFTHP